MSTISLIFKSALTLHNIYALESGILNFFDKSSIISFVAFLEHSNKSDPIPVTIKDPFLSKGSLEENVSI